MSNADDTDEQIDGLLALVNEAGRLRRELAECRQIRAGLAREVKVQTERAEQAEAALAAVYAAIPRGAIRDFAESGVAAKMRYSQQLILHWLNELPREQPNA